MNLNLPRLVNQPRQSHYLQPMHRLEHCEFPDAHQISTVPYSHRTHGYAHPPAPPPSPPVEDNSKCSLPSISTLLVFANAGTPNGTGADRQPHSPRYQQCSGPTLPPTPPMRAGSVYECSNSPTMASTSPSPSSSSSSYFISPTSSSHGGGGNRNSYPPAQHQRGGYSSPEPTYHSHYSSYLPPAQSLAYTSNPWQHHHHSSPASHASFPQSQDRYICQTCSKAFSRPSSLRIHSHSHTGEKPFKCPHHGCGKAFSVRSNMKRHERGCHQ